MFPETIKQGKNKLYEEDERMALPVATLLQNGLQEEVVCDTIKQIAQDLNDKFTDDVKLFNYRTNMKQFLRSYSL